MMKKIELPNKLISELRKLPETGMGYQLVDLKLNDGRTLKKIVVLNSSTVDTDIDIPIDKIIGIKLSIK